MPQFEADVVTGPCDLPAKARPVDRYSPASEKIRLFRALFRGRSDVYARRFESRRGGRAGYAPACAHEWIRGLCEKPRIKCADCPNRRFLPLNDAIVESHLSGIDPEGRECVIGLYPLLLDESCFFVAADFDGADWERDVRAYRETCSLLGISAAVERSRSGSGGHVWVLFDEAVPAALARRLGSHILTETMERRPEIGFDSYDRLFPNQNTLPKGGFGNLIALPLQGRARRNGNSVFLDESFEPHPDQWAFLASIEPLRRTRLEEITARAEAGGRVMGVSLSIEDEEQRFPWLPPSQRRKQSPIAGPLPSRVDVVLGDQVYISRDNIPPALRNRIVRLAAFQNPEFHRAESMRLPTWGKPRILHCAREYPEHLALPRGCLEDLQALARTLGIEMNVREERCAGAPLDVSFAGSLRFEQKAAAEALLAFDTGVLAAPPGFGKTVIAAWLIAQRRVNTLILVHRQQLQQQWIDRLAAFLARPPSAIGRLEGGRDALTGEIDVALIQSLARRGDADERIRGYGHLIVDECHHVPARSFEEVTRRATARYVTGLSATVTRKDGRHPIIFMQCGAVRHRASAEPARATRVEHRVIVRPTAFRDEESRPGPGLEFHRLSQALVRDDERNGMICSDVMRALGEGRAPLVLTERTDHLEELGRRLTSDGVDVITLRGGMGRKAQRDAMDRIRRSGSGGARVIAATGSFIGEGFDEPRLDTLFLAFPISWRGTIAQYVGRLHRIREGKREMRVYDYADLEEPMLARMFDRRCRGYESIGYRIELPASAVPGWPVDIPLPVETAWKKDYAATVRRLARDGVAPDLASLFAQSVCTPDPEAEGTDRARSAMEAFLFRRLETLPETAGRFRLNTDIGIPFDGYGRMEVDLICTDARLAIEIDGGQHLGDASAYRRDRRKDALLQQNGYLVLRFLGEDVGKRLDEVLDRILAALANREAGRTDMRSTP
jgi:superfamily II DNA or RNA helicase/very-short-patch-repair endonuclease